MPFSITVVSSTCTRCAQDLPQDREHFYQRQDGSFCAHCRECNRRMGREARSAGSRFGVEVEFIGSLEAVTSAIRAAGINVQREGYNHGTKTYWKVLTDASVMGGGEVVSPPLKGTAGRRDLRKVLDAMRSAGVAVNASCGLHVHHDVGKLSLDAVKLAYSNWHRSQSNINWLLARSRRSNRWAGPLTSSDLSRMEGLPALDKTTLQRHFNAYGVDRYRALNVASFPKYGTLEMRQHQGTLNADKVLAWVDFGQAFFAAAKAGQTLNADLGTLGLLAALKAHGKLSAASHDYLVQRATDFAAADGHTLVAV